METLEEAYIYYRSVTADVYERHRDKLQEEIALAELELHDARIDAIDVTGLLAFAEQLLSRTSGPCGLRPHCLENSRSRPLCFPMG